MRTIAVMAAWLIAALSLSAQAQVVRVGSKNFTEQYVVAQIYALALERAGFTVQRRINLGTTWVVHSALLAGEVDLYPEYTGTALANLVKPAGPVPDDEVYSRVRSFYADRLGLAVLDQTAIDSGYVMVVRRETAERYHLATLSDLAAVAPKLSVAAAGEFGDRADGLPGLRRVYGIQFRSFHKFAVKSLTYAALEDGDVDVLNTYGTDWQLATGALVPLRDDRHLFPPYFLTPIVRQDTLAANPRIAEVLNALGPRLTNARMQAMNAAVEHDRKDPAEVAREFLDGAFDGDPTGMRAAAPPGTRGPLHWALSHAPQIGRAALQHLLLSLAGVTMALIVATPLAIVSARRPRLYAAALTVATAVFVIPSLALFALLIPIMGLGVKPALTGLSAYCVLLLLRNIVTALRSVPADVLDAADGLGFGRARRLLKVELPLAVPLLVAGVRVALVSAIGIATIAAFIDAGGLGTIILSGIDQNDPDKVIVGGVTTALLALGCDRALSVAERRLSRWRRA